MGKFPAQPACPKASRKVSPYHLNVYFLDRSGISIIRQAHNAVLLDFVRAVETCLESFTFGTACGRIRLVHSYSNGQESLFGRAQQRAVDSGPEPAWQR